MGALRGALVLAALLLVEPSWAAAAPPNIVIIIADDLGWNDVGYHGSEISTPRLDRLAETGLVLEQFHAHPVCSPTRAALMTGKSPVRLGVLQPISKNNPVGLPLGERTLAEFFHDAGYQTYLSGKWHLGWATRAYQPTARGFDHFYGYLTGGIGYWDHVHGGGLDWQRDGVTLREPGYGTNLIADDAVRAIAERDTARPLLLVVSFNAPHLPNEAPAEAIARYAQIENPFRRSHAAMVSELDTAIGQVIDALDARGMLENTLVWFTSDNGGLNPDAIGGRLPAAMAKLQDWLGKPLPFQFLEFLRTNTLEGGSDNRPFRRGKGSVYEGGTRVPSLIYWRGTLAPRHVAEMVTVQDMLPSLLGAAGHSAAGAGFDGVDMWPMLTGRTEVPAPDYVTHALEGEAYYRFPWKLVALGSGEPELYDLAADPTERTNLAVQQPAVVADLSAALARFPHAESIDLPLYRIVLDPDFFGGEEDREPWADRVQGETTGAR